MDDFTRQITELELLASIYGKHWKMNSRGEGEHTIDVKYGKTTVSMYFSIPQNYPSISPPVYEISAPQLTKKEKGVIHNALRDIYAENVGETVLYQYVEKVKELLESFSSDSAYSTKRKILGDNTKMSNFVNGICPPITHGEVIEDRRSIFQGHVAAIKSEKDVNVVLENLKKVRKIADATHNIFAWKLGDHKDYDDDGEKGAGSKLLHMLDMLNVRNVVVVVTRWYGGSHLGAARFRHINNAARTAIVLSGLK